MQNGSSAAREVHHRHGSQRGKRNDVTCPSSAKVTPSEAHAASLGSGAARDRICEPCERARSEDDRVEKPAPALIHRPCWCKIKELPLINISAIRACSPTKQQRLSGIRQRTRGITFEKPPDRTRNAPPTIGTGEGSSQHTD